MGKKLAVAGVVGVALVGGLAYFLYKVNEEVKISNFIGEDGVPDFDSIDNAMEKYELGGRKKSDSGFRRFFNHNDPLDEMLGYPGKVNMNVKKSTDI
jgi:hypothetical protein